MTERKNNIRSMRFTDEMIQLINQQPGHTFTARFEALVTKCLKELPDAERRLEEIKEQRQREQEKYHDMRKRVQLMNATITHLQVTLDRAIGDLEKL